MKCEKQRHQGEANGSKPGSGAGALRPHASLRGGEAQAARAPQPSLSRDSPARALGSSGCGEQLLIMPSFTCSLTHSFIRSTHLPRAQQRAADQLCSVQ